MLTSVGVERHRERIPHDGRDKRFQSTARLRRQVKRQQAV